MRPIFFFQVALLAGCFGTTVSNPDWPPETDDMDGSTRQDSGGKDASTTDACTNCGVDSGDGDGGSIACPTCSGALPYCGPNGACVVCLQSSQCPTSDPVCSGNACIGCTGPGDCAARAGTLACDTSSGDCVECTDADQSACVSQDKVCKAGGKTCVECNTNTDCPEAAPHCNESHACEPCSDNGHCSGWKDGQRVLGLCVAGTCEECTVANEGPCGADSCNPKTLRCTDTARNSRTVCQPCEADSECKEKHRCVETFFDGASQGGHCLRIDEPAVANECVRPYTGAITRGSLSYPSKTEIHCGFSEERTSCEAILGLVGGNECPSGEDSSCPGRGALCRKVGTADNQCTYACEVSGECPSSRPCGSFDNQNIGYCGGQQ